MKRQELERLERKYRKCGLPDYRLRNIGDLKAVHGVDVTELEGYSGLTDENRELFNRTVVRFFNAWGLDNRKELKPKSIHYVTEIEYEKEINEDEAVDVGVEIYVIDSKTSTKKHRLHRYVFEKSIPFSECRKYVKNYLRFELKGVWFHITENGEWY